MTEKTEHWPIKHQDRKTLEFKWWACEGCNETFQTKREFNTHIIKVSKKPVFQNLLHQGK